MQNLKKADATSPYEVGSETQLDLRPAPALGLADGSQPDVPSPARTLQQRLADDLTAEAADGDGVRWAPRTTLLFSIGASLAIWVAVAVGIAAFR